MNTKERIWKFTQALPDGMPDVEKGEQLMQHLASLAEERRDEMRQMLMTASTQEKIDALIEMFARLDVTQAMQDLGFQKLLVNLESKK